MKRTPLVRRTPLRATQPLRATSTKGRARNAAYAKVRPLVVARDGGLCQRCGAVGTDVHHKAGRVGQALTDVDHMVLLCRCCHDWCGENPAAAVEQGYSERRVA